MSPLSTKNGPVMYRSTFFRAPAVPSGVSSIAYVIFIPSREPSPK